MTRHETTWYLRAVGKGGDRRVRVCAAHAMTMYV